MFSIFPALQLLGNLKESIRKHIIIAIVALFLIAQIGPKEPKCSSAGKMDVQTAVYPYNGTLLKHTGRWTTDVWSDVHKSKTVIMLSERS